MRGQLFVVPVIVAWTFALALSAAPDDRDEMNAAFQKMVNANKRGAAKGVVFAPGAPTGPLVKIPTTPAGSNVRNMVRIWARLATHDPNGRNVQQMFPPTDEYVSLTEYRWKNDEAFYLCFEAGVPVRFALYNVKVKPGGVREPEKPAILPSEEWKVEVGEMIPAGKRYQLPIPLICEGGKDEEILLLFAENGNPKLKEVPLVNGRPNIAVLARTLDELQEKARKDRARFTGLLVATPPKQKSKDIEDVVSTAVLSETDTSDGLTGELPIVLKR